MVTEGDRYRLSRVSAQVDNLLIPTGHSDGFAEYPCKLSGVGRVCGSYIYAVVLGKIRIVNAAYKVLERNFIRIVRQRQVLGNRPVVRSERSNVVKIGI